MAMDLPIYIAKVVSKYASIDYLLEYFVIAVAITTNTL